MKVLLLGNMVQDHLHLGRAIKQKYPDFDINLLINDSEYKFGKFSWEFGDAPVPPWAIIRRASILTEAAFVMSTVKKYDIVQSLSPYPMYAQFGAKKHVILEAGWMKKFPFKDDHVSALARRAYSRASCIVQTNPDFYDIQNNIPYLKNVPTCFIPFAIDTERYISNPTDIGTSDEHRIFRVFSATRQFWPLKGNDRLIQGFKLFVDNYPDVAAELMMVDYGVDIFREEAKRLVKSLGLESKVKWIEPMLKSELIKQYQAADVVADQFIQGSSGTAGLEAMSCGKPLLIYLDKWTEQCYGDMPPVMNVRTAEQIEWALAKLVDHETRRKIGEDSREWVQSKCSYDVVASKFMHLYTTLGGHR